jgi:hypothetical protein
MIGPYDPDRNELAADDGGALLVPMIMMLAGDRQYWNAPGHSAGSCMAVRA